MEPQTQYAKTSDGVSIAYSTMGDGLPLVMIPNAFIVAGSWDDVSQYYETLAQQKRLISFDGRGSGMSQRLVDDLSIEASIRDLEAVIDELDLSEFVLYGPNVSAPIAISYATRRPDRVSHLILWCPTVRASDMLDTSMGKGLDALLGTDWDLATELMAQLAYGFAGGESARRYAAAMRESTTAETAKRLIDSWRNVDVSDLLPQVSVPTLVMHRKEMIVPALDVSQGIAAAIPGARLALIEGDSMLPHLEHGDALVAAVNEFLGLNAPEPALSGAAKRDAGGLVTILFTDVEGSTSLTDRLGDAKARDLLREHERLTREALKAHSGSEIKTMGDGFMASFGSPTQALECAISLQQSFAERNESADEPIRVRIGLNAGEPIAEDEDLFGTAVNVAARVAAKAQGGEILVSDVVRQLVAGKKFPFSDRGETELKGLEDPVRLFEVGWRDTD